MFNRTKVESLCDHNSEIEYFYNSVFEVAKNTSPDALFLEIGTRAGGTALLALNAILDSNIQRYLITVDPYGQKPYFAGEQAMGGIYGEDYSRVAMYEIAKFCNDYNLNHSHFRLESNDFMNMFESVKFWCNGKINPVQFGYVYLDGEHTEEAMFTELSWFLPKMVKNGLIVIDDVSYNPTPKNELLKEIFGKSINKGNRAFYHVEDKRI